MTEQKEFAKKNIYIYLLDSCKITLRVYGDVSNKQTKECTIPSMALVSQTAHTQADSARAEKQQALMQAEEERGEVERLRQERDHYRRLTEEKGEEVVKLRSTVERATLQLEEKEKMLSTVRQQSTSISQLMEVNNRFVRERSEKEMLITCVSCLVITVSDEDCFFCQ